MWGFTYAYIQVWCINKFPLCFSYLARCTLVIRALCLQQIVPVCPVHLGASLCLFAEQDLIVPRNTRLRRGSGRTATCLSFWPICSPIHILTLALHTRSSMAAGCITTSLMGCVSRPNSHPELVGAEKGGRCVCSQSSLILPNVFWSWEVSELLNGKEWLWMAARNQLGTLSCRA